MKKITNPSLQRENDLIDATIQEEQELVEQLQYQTHPLVCEAIQNQIDELRAALNTITIWNVIH